MITKEIKAAMAVSSFNSGFIRDALKLADAMKAPPKTAQQSKTPQRKLTK